MELCDPCVLNEFPSILMQLITYGMRTEKCKRNVVPFVVEDMYESLRKA